MLEVNIPAGKSNDYHEVVVFVVVFHKFPVYTYNEHKPGVFKFLQFEERFRKAPFPNVFRVDYT